MTDWPDVARSWWTKYQQFLSTPFPSDLELRRRERELVELVPRLLAEISKRDALLTAVRRLTATEDCLYERDPAEVVVVGQIRKALGEEVRGG